MTVYSCATFTKQTSRRPVITRRMAIANGTCFSFCNQPKAILASLGWVRPWDNRGKCHIDEKKIQCLSTHRSRYPSIFNRFPVIQPESSKVRHFSTFFCTFWPPLGTPWDNRGKCYMDRKKIQCCSNASQYVPIYLQPFTTAIARYWSKIAQLFSTPLHLTPPLGVFPSEFREKFGPQKTRIMGLPGSEDSLTIG